VGEQVDARHVRRIRARKRPVLRPPVVQVGERRVDVASERSRERVSALRVVALDRQLRHATQLSRVARKRELPHLVAE